MLETVRPTLTTTNRTTAAAARADRSGLGKRHVGPGRASDSRHQPVQGAAETCSDGCERLRARHDDPPFGFRNRQGTHTDLSCEVVLSHAARRSRCAKAFSKTINRRDHDMNTNAQAVAESSPDHEWSTIIETACVPPHHLGVEIDPKAVGARIRERRESLGLVQEDLARAAKVRGLAISELELGKTENPKTMTIAAIATELGVTVDWILYGPRASEGTVDSRDADELPLSSEDLMAQAARIVGLSATQTRDFLGERRRGGMPYTLSTLITVAEGYRVAEKATLPYSAATDQAPVEQVTDPEGDAAPRLKSKNGKSRR